MDSYKIEILKSADRDARKVDRQKLKRIVEAIRALSENPFPQQSRKLKGSESSYRVRIGDYRVLYEVDTENKVVLVFHIRHRKDAYRK